MRQAPSSEKDAVSKYKVENKLGLQSPSTFVLNTPVHTHAHKCEHTHIHMTMYIHILRTTNIDRDGINCPFLLTN